MRVACNLHKMSMGSKGGTPLDSTLIEAQSSGTSAEMFLSLFASRLTEVDRKEKDAAGFSILGKR